MSLEINIKKAHEYLEQFRTQGVMHRIDGQDVSSNDQFETKSPADHTALAQVSRGGASEIDQAAKSAKKAFADWSVVTGKARRDILHAVADGIVARAEEIAFIEAMDTGQTIRFMSKAAMRGAENFRFFADQAPFAADGKSLFTSTQMNVTSRTPIGPVGIITPWNTPFMLSTWKIAPALAAGCTVVHKPAELSPLSARLLIEIAENSGVPAGVWNMVNGFGEDAGCALTEHPDIKAIAFVGESRTGAMIMKQGADTLKRVHFELGGKNPIIVFKDADLERAADAAVFMIYSLNGERCTSSSRLLVEAEIYEDFTAKVAEKAAKITVGHPLDPAATIGPLIDPNHLQKVTSYFDIAQQEGATIATGGRTIDGPGGGCYVAPTLLTDATNDMRISQEEIFGPVLTALPFRTEAEAIAMANDVSYGLAGYLWTNDLKRGLRISDALEAGMIWVNSENNRHLPAPFGGTKNSGIGRDGGDWSFEFYMETKNVAFAMTDHKIPKLGE